MLDANKLKADILSDMRVELSEEFDRNFERKAFFSDKWKPRAHDYPRGSLLIVSGAMRRSTQGEVSGDGVRFTSSEPYTSLHNGGGTGYKTVRAHTRRSKKGKVYTVRAHQRKFNMPQRQFIGDGPDTQHIIKTVIDDNLKQFNLSLSNFIRNK
ncbi:MAG: hypothetical protein HDS69_09940 [Bacteroidales bacterium]|nr:hypothetical protein [Bacteroidales bacterium]